MGLRGGQRKPEHKEKCYRYDRSLGIRYHDENCMVMCVALSYLRSGISRPVPFSDHELEGGIDGSHLRYVGE